MSCLINEEVALTIQGCGTSRWSSPVVIIPLYLPMMKGQQECFDNRTMPEMGDWLLTFFQVCFHMIMSFHSNLLLLLEAVHLATCFWNVIWVASLPWDSSSLPHPPPTLPPANEARQFRESMNQGWTHYGTSGARLKAPGELLLTSLLTHLPNQSAKSIRYTDLFDLH